jgi:hypothetical protein
VRDEIFHAAAAACLTPSRETPFLLACSSQRPADVLLPSFSLGRPAALDCACTHPQQHRFLSDAGVRAGAAAERYAEETKVAMYAEKCQANGIDFHPMVVESYGVWCSSARAMLAFIATMCASRSGGTAGAARQRLVERLSITLQRCNARALLARRDPNSAGLDDPVV